MLEGNRQGYLSTLLRNGATPFARPSRGVAASNGGEQLRPRPTFSGELQSAVEPAPKRLDASSPDVSSDNFHEASSANSQEASSANSGESVATPETSIHNLFIRSAATRSYSSEAGDAGGVSAPVNSQPEERQEFNRRRVNADHKPAAESVSRVEPAIIGESVQASITGESLKASSIIDEGIKPRSRRDVPEARGEEDARIVESEIAAGVESETSDSETSFNHDEAKVGAEASPRAATVSTTRRARTTHQSEPDGVAQDDLSPVTPSREASPARDAAPNDAPDLRSRVITERVHDLRFLYRATRPQKTTAHPVFSKPDEEALPEENSTQVVATDPAVVTAQHPAVNVQKSARAAHDSWNSHVESDDGRFAATANQRDAATADQRDSETINQRAADSTTVQPAEASEALAALSFPPRALHKSATHDLRHLFRDAPQISPPDAAAYSMKQTSNEEIRVSVNQSRRGDVNAELTETNFERASRTEKRTGEAGKRADEDLKQTATQARDEISEHHVAEVRAGEAGRLEARQLEARQSEVPQSVSRSSVESFGGAQEQTSAQAEHREQRRHGAAKQKAHTGQDAPTPRFSKSDVAQNHKSLAARNDESLATRNDESLAAHAGGSSVRDAAHSQPATVNDKGAFSLKVNRLDIKLVNQTPKLPPAPTPRQTPAQPQSEDYLERHYLGRFYLDV